MAEYMVKIRVDDSEGVGKDAIKDGVEDLLDSINGHAPFYLTIDSIEKAMPKSVDDIMMRGICPKCGIESLSEDERGEEHISFICGQCDASVYVGRDDFGIDHVSICWIDDSKPMFEDEMEETIYARPLR